MSQDPTIPNQPFFEIHIAGRLSPEWAKWFGNMALTIKPTMEGLTCTVLSGPVIDQAELFGILNRIRDLGLKLISVNSIQPEFVEGIHEE